MGGLNAMKEKQTSLTKDELQLTQKGEGVATAMRCRKLNVPYILIAANAADLEMLLVIRCGVEPETFDREKFINVKVSEKS